MSLQAERQRLLSLLNDARRSAHDLKYIFPWSLFVIRIFEHLTANGFILQLLVF